MWAAAGTQGQHPRRVRSEVCEVQSGVSPGTRTTGYTNSPRPKAHRHSAVSSERGWGPCGRRRGAGQGLPAHR